MIDELVLMNISKDKLYGARVSELIRERYSLDAELAILRQRDEKPDEYQAYFAFCEECKARARKEIYTQQDES